jgi:ketosteroid isomerase-like protein
MSDEAMRALAKRFFDCIEAGDIEGLVACYAPDAVIWHNSDGAEQGPAENAQTLRGFVARIAHRVYDERRVAVFEDGFVQQHLLRGRRAKDGGPVALPACIVCQVKDGRITRLDEYFDSAHLAQFRSPAPPTD